MADLSQVEAHRVGDEARVHARQVVQVYDGPPVLIVFWLFIIVEAKAGCPAPRRAHWDGHNFILVVARVLLSRMVPHWRGNWQSLNFILWGQIKKPRILRVWVGHRFH